MKEHLLIWVVGFASFFASQKANAQMHQHAPTAGDNRLPEIALTKETKEAWEAGFEDAKTYYSQNFGQADINDITLEFDANKAFGARYDEGNDKIYINPSFAERYLASKDFILGHEFAHPVHENERDELSNKAEEAFHQNNDPLFNNLSRIREGFCDSLGAVYAGHEATILYFETRLLNERQDIQNILHQTIPELEGVELVQDTMLRIELPLKQRLSEGAKTDFKNSIFSAVEFFAQRDPKAQKQGFRLVPTLQAVEEIQYLLENERTQGTHGSYAGRAETGEKFCPERTAAANGKRFKRKT